MFESGRSPSNLASRPSDLASLTTTLIVLNEEMNGSIKIVKSLEESGLLIKGVSKRIQNEAKKQKGRFLSVLLGTLRSSLLRNLVTGKGIIGAVEGTITAGPDFQCRLIL